MREKRERECERSQKFEIHSKKLLETHCPYFGNLNFRPFDILTFIRNYWIQFAPGEKICKLCLQEKFSIQTIKGLKFSDTVSTENSIFSTTSKNNTYLPQVNNNSGNTIRTNNSVV